MKDEHFPLVSIAVVTYNQKKYLYECIESILRQDYPNIEIIVADDGSIDGTQGMLQDYKSKYPYKFILKLADKNQGITANSNAAHFSCSGKYIAWIGGDDVMLPNKISKQVQYMEDHPNCTICYHQHEAFDDESGDIKYLSFKKYKKRQGDVKVAIKYGTFNGALASMVRRDKAPANGFNNLIPVASDWLYWVDSLANGGRIEYIDDILARYRKHASNVTNRHSTMGQNVIDHLNSCNIIIAKYPVYFREASYRYGRVLMENRDHLPYLPTLWFAFKVTYSMKAMFGIIVFLATLGSIKI